MNPKKLAESLTAHFLEMGNFVSAGGPIAGRAIPASTRVAIDNEVVGFSGLAIESVGYAVIDDEESLARDQSGLQNGVYIYVSNGSKRYLDTLPKEISGIPCSVRNIGKLSVKPRQSAVATHRGNLYEKVDRIACGSSCAPSGKQYSGTLGALVRKGGGGGLFALSNNHIFADCNHVSVGQPILSPSASDSHPGLRSPSEICRHSEIVELRSGCPALVSPCREDIAIAEVTDASLLSSWQGDEANGYDTPTRVASPRTGMRVKKFGRTTGLTRGRMESAQHRMSIPYEAEFFRSLVWFKDVWTIVADAKEHFALPGDSGSLVVTEDGAAAVGVVFAVGAKGTAFAIPMDRVSQAFGGISLVANHGV